MKKKSVRIILITLGVLILLAGGGLAYYRLSRIQGTIEASAINATLKGQEVPQVVVYTQDRTFKNEVMDKVTAAAEGQQIYLEIQPIEDLQDSTQAWDKVILFTTVMSSEPPENALDFINAHKEDEKVAIFLTADSSRWAHQPSDVDAFTGASSNSGNVDVFADKMLAFMDL